MGKAVKRDACIPSRAEGRRHGGSGELRSDLASRRVTEGKGSLVGAIG